MRLIQFLIGIGFVLIIWAGVPLAVRGEITVGIYCFQPVSLASDLAADRAWVCRQSLSAGHCQLNDSMPFSKSSH